MLKIINNIKPIIYSIFGFICLNIRNKNKYKLYLTFDDGPISGTINCFSLCKKYGIKASFFFVGQNISNFDNGILAKLIVNDNIIICNHSFTHAFKENYNLFYDKPVLAFDDFINCEEILKSSNKFIRLPGRNSWSINSKKITQSDTKNITETLDKKGYSIVGWDFDYNLYKKKKPFIKYSPLQLIGNMYLKLLLNKVFKKNNIIILLHDNLFENTKHLTHLEKFISKIIKSKNFEFCTINDF